MSAVLDSMLIVIGAAAGWAVLMAALVVLHEIDLREGRWLLGLAWLAVATAGGWLTIWPGLTHRAPDAATVVLAIAFAWVAWLNITRLTRQATDAPRRVVSFLRRSEGANRA